MWSSTVASIIKCETTCHYAHFNERALPIDLPKGLEVDLKSLDPAASLQKTQRTEEQVKVYQE